MPDFDEIQRYLWGAWRMMNGHPDGLDLLDFSEDGFWQSFHAITISLPPLILGWIIFANDMIALRPETGNRFSIMGRVAFVDLASWVLPLVVLALSARQLGIAKRFSPYVVASNWGTAIGAWLMVPATLARVLLPGWPILATGFGLALYGVILFLTYRLTHVALKKSHAYTAVFFVALVAGSLFVMILLQAVLGISLPEQAVIG
ncbi:hypothetical protein CU102_13315 [Phyllobacterium brassicacearum]|uniref:Transporter n=1 Tax=Phyllobacterium brassicacearum TaxID=314235 RepID=A0A2P7BPP4_9HYPH|nr:hypothetical protein [Phyllobacterium brassicacearum]PSH68448.1 hypothetical protein CU102_13315 [Phyllobacterium brassicacearum]TDQ31869.1 hypothetical protein DEV91_107208 [Phyllobacterium brassicacearum]